MRRVYAVVMLSVGLVGVVACPDREARCAAAEAAIKNDQAKVDTMTVDGIQSDEQIALAALVKDIAAAKAKYAEECQQGSTSGSW